MSDHAAQMIADAQKLIHETAKGLDPPAEQADKS